MNLFNRNDGTFAALQASDVAGIPAPTVALLNTLTPVGGTQLSFIDVTSLTMGYNNYELAFENLVSGSATDSFLLQFSINGGSSYLNSAYIAGIAMVEGSQGAGFTWTNQTSTIGIPISGNSGSFQVGNAGSYGLSGSVKIFNSGAAVRTLVTGDSVWVNNTNTLAALFSGKIYGYQDSASVFNALKITTLGNAGFISGVIKVYGRN